MMYPSGGDEREPVRIVSAAGGEFTGRTRLQKTAFLLELAGLGSGYRFTCGRFGLFSEEFAAATDQAPLFYGLRVDRKTADWGGSYSVFTTKDDHEPALEEAYRRLVSIAKEASSIDLEIAATAAYLAKEGFEDPWGETERRNPKLAVDDRLDRAKELYRDFKGIELPEELPDI